MALRAFVAMAVFVAGTAALTAQPPVPPAAGGIVGIWEGPLKIGAVELRLAFHVAADKDGKLTVTLDSIDQGAKGVPCGDATFDGKKFVVEMPKMKARYEATLSEAGPSLKGTFEQAGLKLPLELKRVEKVSTLNRPQLPKKPYPYRDEEVKFANPAAKFELAGTLTLPPGDGPFPAAVLVSGSGPQDRDETLFGHKPFLVLADHLTRKGIAVLRYDDRGVGKSGGKAEGATTADFATDAHAAVTFLQSRKEIDPKRIGIIGHSEGGMIAPMVAAGHPGDVAFIVLLAGPGVPGEQVLKGQAAAIMKAMSVEPETIALAGRMMDALVRVAKEPGPAAERKKKLEAVAGEFLRSLSPEEQKSLKMGEPDSQPTLAAARLGDEWMQFFLSYDPAPYLAKVRCPVLAVNGDLDLQVLHAENLAGIEQALKAGGNRDVTTKSFAGHNHLFQRTKSGLPTEYGQIEETFSPEALEFIAGWVAKRR